jgi:hypothetical protein
MLKPAGQHVLSNIADLLCAALCYNYLGPISGKQGIP